MHRRLEEAFPLNSVFPAWNPRFILSLKDGPINPDQRSKTARDYGYQGDVCSRKHCAG